MNRPRRKYTPAERRELGRAVDDLVGHVQIRTRVAIAKRRRPPSDPRALSTDPAGS